MSASLPAVLLSEVVKPVHPTHLPTSDPSLSTEILPAPPPLPSLVGLNPHSHAKRVAVLSYLPMVDPGSTYVNPLSSAGNAVAPEVSENGRKRKRTRMDKIPPKPGRSGLRNSTPIPKNDVEMIQSNTTSLPSGPPLTQGSDLAPDDQRSPSLTPPPSESNPPDVVTLRTRPKRDGKSKGKEVQLHVEDLTLEKESSAGTDKEELPQRNVKDKESGKGKGKDKELNVEPETHLTSLASNHESCASCLPVSSSFQPGSSSLLDHTSSSLVYCDGCPRSFHFICLDPPILNEQDGAALPEGGWWCRVCLSRGHPITAPPPGPNMFDPLYQLLESSIPREFQLPVDIRRHYKDVVTGPRGGYLDARTIRFAKGNRQLNSDDREPFRLKDRNGNAVLCYKCGQSALPPPSEISSASTFAVASTGSSISKRKRRSSGGVTLQPDTKRQRGTQGMVRDGIRADYGATDLEGWRPIASCDHCSLHWHLDCLSPPLSTMPAKEKKWMCPNHAEQTQSRPRIPRDAPPPIEIKRPGQRNNGVIEIIPTEPPAKRAKLSGPDPGEIDEMWIGGRKYLVPERVVVLDFWDKLSRIKNGSAPEEEQADKSSATSSPLTELSSLDTNIHEIPPLSLNGHAVSEAEDDLLAAELLCALRDSHAKSTSHGGLQSSRSYSDVGVQTETEALHGVPSGTVESVGADMRRGRPRKRIKDSEPDKKSTTEQNIAGPLHEKSIRSSNAKTKPASETTIRLGSQTRRTNSDKAGTISLPLAKPPPSASSSVTEVPVSRRPVRSRASKAAASSGTLNEAQRSTPPPSVPLVRTRSRRRALDPVKLEAPSDDAESELLSQAVSPAPADITPLNHANDVSSMVQPVSPKKSGLTIRIPPIAALQHVGTHPQKPNVTLNINNGAENPEPPSTSTSGVSMTPEVSGNRRSRKSGPNSTPRRKVIVHNGVDGSGASRRSLRRHNSSLSESTVSSVPPMAGTPSE